MPKEPELHGVVHIIAQPIPHPILSDYIYPGVCGQVTNGEDNGHFNTTTRGFISEDSNRISHHRYIHCRWCDETLTDFDHINATDVE